MSGRYTVKVRLDPVKVCGACGLGASGNARRYLARRVRQRCDKYVPKDTGLLKNTAAVSADGRAVTYPQSYAQKQFYVNYRHADPNRGAQWHQRMLRREGGALTAEVGAYIKRRPG